MRVALTKRSSNVKVGRIPVSTTSKHSCPPSCPLRDNGSCYAMAGFHTNLHWNHVTSGTRGVEWEEFCQQISDLTPGQLWRHNVAGDLPPDANDENLINEGMIQALTDANRGRKGFTYTHYDPGYRHNRHLIQEANDNGFTVNLSANDVDEAIDYRNTYGLPTVTLLPEDCTEGFVLDGHQVVVCPAVTHDNVNCDSCRLCQHADRKVIVGFPAHGTKRHEVDLIARG